VRYKVEGLKKPKIIYVYSGKGGVGKSTVCVNLAYSFLSSGFKVGIFDADLSGPSIPSLVKAIEDKPSRIEGISVVPGIFGGMKISSSGLIYDATEDSFFDGKYLSGALYQLVFSVKWDVDILLIDLPPGTTTLHREMFVNLPGDVLMVTTPQDISYSDTIRSIDFVKRLNMNILGVVENMAYYICDNCSSKEILFNGRTKEILCDPFKIKLLAKLPFDKKLNEFSNVGKPYVLFNPNEKLAYYYEELAKGIYSQSQREFYKGVDDNAS
jgi:ATP-binding protein involved in chromosome partitioning